MQPFKIDGQNRQCIVQKNEQNDLETMTLNNIGSMPNYRLTQLPRYISCLTILKTKN